MSGVRPGGYFAEPDIRPPTSRQDADERSPTFASFFLGGFECSTKRRFDGCRLDLVESTGHGRLFEEDYRTLMDHGILTVRDGLRWHLVGADPSRYDWSSAIPMLRAARGCGIQVIWDLCHYGWPDWLDIWSPDFVRAFARYAAEAARVVGDETDGVPFFCTINEISYWAWAGGDASRFAPACRGRGTELKRQLVRASIAATREIKRVNPRARFVHAEPLIHVEPSSPGSANREAAERCRVGQFEALDMMIGRLAPELGGQPAFLDIVGVNFYPDNQWVLGGGTVPLGHHAYRPFRDMLREVHDRYRRPMMVAETGAEGSARPSWLHYVTGEVAAARQGGVPLAGICLYPVLDYPGWDNDRLCKAGLLSMPDRNGFRQVDPGLAAELRVQQAMIRTARRPRFAVPVGQLE